MKLTVTTIIIIIMLMMTISGRSYGNYLKFFSKPQVLWQTLSKCYVCMVCFELTYQA